MYINEKVRLISSTLSSLTLSELELLREEIHSIITNYGGNITGSFIVGGYNVQVLSSGISTNTKTIPQTSFRTESTVINSPVISCKIGEIKQLAPTQNSPRPLGIWKGKVEISEDFNKTSSDIISEFGIE
ncbi:hypothetical protein [uncultured Nostoc sp.]|uniref:hypothetical protein n=1 Tax=uncultured Nostoc sp. TaxID=340711 RepID=UPI0035CBC355